MENDKLALPKDPAAPVDSSVRHSSNCAGVLTTPRGSYPCIWLAGHEGACSFARREAPPALAPDHRLLERDFWERCFLLKWEYHQWVLEGSSPSERAAKAADEALAEWLKRWVK